MVSNTVILDIFALGYSFQDKVGDVSNIINNVIAAVFELGGGILNAPPPSEGDREAFNEVRRIYPYHLFGGNNMTEREV